MYMTSQINPNLSSANLHQLKDARMNRFTAASSPKQPQPVVSSRPKPRHFPLPYLSLFGSFSTFQLPLTPPVSTTGSPVREYDSYGFSDEKSRSLNLTGDLSIQFHNTPTKSSSSKLASWLPPVDLHIVSLCFAWYMCSAVSSNLTKSILSKFNYPITLTEVQFCLNCLFCLFTLQLTMLYNFNLPRGFAPKKSSSSSSLIKFMVPTQNVLKTTLPMGMFQFVGHLSSHKATSMIPVSLVSTVKALSPITTVLLYKVFFRVQYNAITYITLAPLILGIMLACYKPKKGRTAAGEASYIAGLFYAFVSMLIFVLQNIFAKKILTWVEKLGELPMTSSELDDDYDDERELKASTIHKDKFRSKSSSGKLDKLTILYNCSIFGFIFTLPIYLLLEFRNESVSLFQIDLMVLLIMILNGVSHFLQSLLAFQILGQISTVNYLIANIMKRIVVILVAIIWEGQSVLYIQGIGLMLTVVGLYCYDRWGVPSKSPK